MRIDKRAVAIVAAAAIVFVASRQSSKARRPGVRATSEASGCALGAAEPAAIRKLAWRITAPRLPAVAASGAR